jgi:hypothetical protein
LGLSWMPLCSNRARFVSLHGPGCHRHSCILVQSVKNNKSLLFRYLRQLCSFCTKLWDLQWDVCTKRIRYPGNLENQYWHCFLNISNIVLTILNIWNFISNKGTTQE